MDKRPWSSVSSDWISEGAIRALHVPSGHFRISSEAYDPGTAFPGTARARTIYVLSGACRFTVRETGESVQLSAREFAQVPEGGYQFAVTGPEPVQLVTVFLLPEVCWRE